MTKASKYQKKKVVEIIQKIDDHIPGAYVQRVSDYLAERGIEVTDARIQNVRTGRAYDINIALALQAIAAEEMSFAAGDTKESLKNRLNLVK